jgi:excinuclease ABC subunit C
MLAASDEERFEQAAQLRDTIRTIEMLRDRQQKMSTPQLGDRDAIGVKLGPAGAVIQVFQMRGGRVIERVELVTEAEQTAGTTDADVVQAALQQFYESRQVHVGMALEEAELIEAWLSERSGRKVRLVIPKRGEKRGLLDLAHRNAAVAYQARFNEAAAAHRDALDEIRVVLSLSATPRRIECFDISTIQGSETVASMVVCEDGRMRRSEYRKYRIRGGSAGGVGPRSEGRAPAARATSESARPCTRSSGGATGSCSNRADRSPISSSSTGGRGSSRRRMRPSLSSGSRTSWRSGSRRRKN